MRAPLNNPDNDSLFNRELTPRELAGIQRKKELANFIFNDLVDKENGVVVAPDTTGVDYFFLMLGMEVENDRTGKTGGRAGVQLLG